MYQSPHIHIISHMYIFTYLGFVLDNTTLLSYKLSLFAFFHSLMDCFAMMRAL